MPRLVVIEGHEGQRRQLEEHLTALEAAGYPLSGKFEAGDLDGGWRSLFERAGTRGLFAERQALVAEGCDSLGPFPDEMSGCLEDEGADAVIIATFAGDTKKVFSRGILALRKISFLRADPSVPPWKRKDWLMNLARERGAKLAPDAAALLGESIESQEELRGELAKLHLYAGGRTITVGDVQALSFDEGGRALLSFLDGVCQARPRDVVRALKYLRQEPVLPVLTSLCNRLRPALVMAAFPRSQEAALKAIGMGSGKDYALRMARGALSVFGGEAIRRFMLGVVRLSFLEKTSRSEGWPGFEQVLWELMGSSGRLPPP
ncbi:MAG: hypothetical protein K6E38_00265 [Fretibacterium sp.]|nr:hypothetical protein [Fretibacterium sp.]